MRSRALYSPRRAAAKACGRGAVLRGKVKGWIGGETDPPPYNYRRRELALAFSRAAALRRHSYGARRQHPEVGEPLFVSMFQQVVLLTVMPVRGLNAT